MSSQLLFIGKMDSSHIQARGGVEIKNRVFYAAMQEIFDKTDAFDLDFVKKPKKILHLLSLLFKYRHDKIVVGGGEVFLLADLLG